MTSEITRLEGRAVARIVSIAAAVLAIVVIRRITKRQSGRIAYLRRLPTLVQTVR